MGLGMKTDEGLAVLHILHHSLCESLELDVAHESQLQKGPSSGFNYQIEQSARLPDFVHQAAWTLGTTKKFARLIETASGTREAWKNADIGVLPCWKSFERLCSTLRSCTWWAGVLQPRCSLRSGSELSIRHPFIRLHSPSCALALCHSPHFAQISSRQVQTCRV